MIQVFQFLLTLIGYIGVISSSEKSFAYLDDNLRVKKISNNGNYTSLYTIFSNSTLFQLFRKHTKE